MDVKFLNEVVKRLHCIENYFKKNMIAYVVGIVQILISENVFKHLFKQLRL